MGQQSYGIPVIQEGTRGVGAEWPGNYKQGNAGLGIHDDWIEIAFITLPLFFLLLLIIRQHPSVSSRYVENSNNLPPPQESCHSYERRTR